MPTIHVGPGSSLELQEVADAMGKSKKVVVVTGAGISTNCGIPDFRSENGLYSLIQAQYDAALQNPPWEIKDDYDIDDRPRKKRKPGWYYQVERVEDGAIVGIIDDEEPSGSQNTLQRASRRSSRSKSSTPCTPSTSEIPKISPAPQNPAPEPTPKQSSKSKSPTPTSSPLSSPPPSSPTEAASEQSEENSADSSIDSSQSSRPDLPNLKGRDLFDSMVWKDPFTTSIFYMFISSLRQKVQDVSFPTPTHEFVKTLQDMGRLVRNYTQNIDCLEERMGMRTELSLGPGTRTRFSAKVQREHFERRLLEPGSNDLCEQGGVGVVQLHGSLSLLRCGLCLNTCSWDDADRATIIASGQAPDCPICTESSLKRLGRGRRELAVGRLRPDIVLYGEEHPKAGLVGPIITHDLALSPDVLLILGTSLKVHGLKIIVREFAKTVHDRGGKVIFVNRTKPPESTWRDVIDYWVGWDCDAWVADLKERRPDIWQPPSSVRDEPRSRASLSRRESSGDAKLAKKPYRPTAIRDTTQCGVFQTFKILDTLRKCQDEDGNMAERKVYWQDLRRLTGDSRAILQPVRKSAKSLPLSATLPKPAAKTRPESSMKDKTAKRKSLPTSKPSPGTFSVCDRCRIRKIGCDKRPGGCSACAQSKTECIMTDRITGGTEPAFRPSLPESKAPRPPASKASPSNLPAHTANSSKKRKSYPKAVQDDRKNMAYLTTTIWEKLRELAPGLSDAPSQEIIESGRLPLHELNANMPSYLKPFSFGFPNPSDIYKRNSPNHYPDMPGLNMPNLVTHPPSGLAMPMYSFDPVPVHSPSSFDLPVHTPPTKTAPRCGYHNRVTRASQRWSTDESTIIVQPEPKRGHSRPSWGSNESTIVVETPVGGQEPTPPDSAPLTPDSKCKRIKRMGSIGAILSSSPLGTEIFQDAEESPDSTGDIFYDAHSQ